MTAPLSASVALPLHDQLVRLKDLGPDPALGLGELLDEVERLVHTDPQAAANLCDLCVETARPLGHHSIMARANYLHARVRAERGEFETALTLIDRARHQFVDAGTPTRAWRTDLGRMKILDDLGRHDDAIAVGRSLIAALDAVALAADDPDELALHRWLRAAARENTGVALSFVGSHHQALELYAEAEQTYHALGMIAETARARANRGIDLLALGRADDALDLLRSAADTFTEAGDRLWWAKCLGNIAQALLRTGRLAEALRVLEPARETMDELGARPEAARLQVAAAEIYLTLGLLGEAHSEARSAARHLESTGLRHDAAIAHLLSALAELGRQHLGGADHELAHAAAEFKEIGDGQQLARVLLAQAEVAQARGDRAAAEALAESASRVLRAGGWKVFQGWAALRRFDLLVDDIGRAGVADEDAASALLAEAQHLALELELPHLRDACHVRAAELHRHRGDLGRAEQVLRDIVGSFDRRDVDLHERLPYTRIDPDRRAAHDQLIDLVLTRGGDDGGGDDGGDGGQRIDDAWQTSDRAKTRAHLDLIAVATGTRPDLDGRTPELQRLRSRLDATYSELVLAGDAAARERLRHAAEELEHHISTLRLRSAVDNDPRDDARPEVARGRPTDRTLAFHVLGDDVLAFVMQDGVARVRRLEKVVPRVELQMQRLTAQWARFRMNTDFAARHTAKLAATSQVVLRALDDLLLAPLRRDGLLAVDDAEGSGLVVVPHGPLHHVPFHALHDGAGYLIERHTVTVAPTSGWFPIPGQHVRRPPRPPLILAVADAHAPFTEAEARSVAAVLPTAQTAIGQAAVSGLLSGLGSSPELVHIACHGLYRAANPLFSALRLADRWLTASEVLALDLNDTTLVTLSACDSGRRGTTTAAPVGLAWAFLAAGARAVVVSQWVVHDEVTAQLMTQMYAGLTRGLPPTTALRAAQLQIAATAGHPFFWAPFTFVTSPSTDLPGAPRVRSA